MIDTRSLDKIISDDACCMFIDGQGNVHGANHTDNVCGNLFRCSLTNLMKKANPKKNVQHTLQSYLPSSVRTKNKIQQRTVK